MKHNKQVFNSMTDLIEAVIGQDLNDLLKESERRSRANDPFFTGSYKLEDAMDLAHSGWEDGRKTIYKYAKDYGYLWRKFFPKQDFTQKFGFSEAGEVPAVEKFIQGEPDDMMTFLPENNFRRTEENNNGKLQRIILNGVCSHYIKPETIFQYGALIAALVHTMEEAGFSVELDVVWKIGSQSFLPYNQESPNDTERVTYILQLKRFSDNLDVDKLGFSIAHSSMLRRFIFSLMECETDPNIIKNIVNRSYGYPINLTENEITNFGGNTENGGKVKGNMYFKLLDNNYKLDQLVNQCTAVVKEHFTEVNFNDPDNPGYVGSFGGE